MKLQDYIISNQGTIESRINRLIDIDILDDENTALGWDLIEDWSYRDKPANVLVFQRLVNTIIFEATPGECLTSQSEYIREAKKFLMNLSEENPSHV